MKSKQGKYNYKRTDFPILIALALWHEGKKISDIAQMVQMSSARTSQVLSELGLTRTRAEQYKLRG